MGLALDRKLSFDVLKLAIPVILGMIFQTSVNLADTIMIGWMPENGESVAGVAAIGITLPLFWAVGGFLSAIAVGTQALTARRFGEGNLEKSGRVLTNSATIAVIFGSIASVIGALLIPFVFPFFNSNPEVVRVGVPYAQLRFLGILSMVVMQGYKAFFDGIGKTYVAMIASIAMNVINIALAALLIFGLWGFPKMGVVGAGWAAMISSYLGSFVIIGWSFIPSIRQKYHFYRLSNLRPRISWEIVRLSLPGGAATVFVMTGVLLFMKIVGIIDQAMWQSSFPVGDMVHMQATLNTYFDKLDSGNMLALINTLLPQIDSLTASSRAPLFTAGTKVIFDIMSLSFMTAIALGTATATLVSRSLGEGNPRLAERYGWTSAKIAIYFMGGLGLVQVFQPQIFLGLFTDKIQVIEAATTSMRIVGFVNFGVGAGLVFMQSLFGAGNAKFVMYVEIILHFTCLVPLAYILGVHFELAMEGCFIAAATYIVLLCSILGWKFRQGRWKFIKI